MPSTFVEIPSSDKMMSAWTTSSTNADAGIGSNSEKQQVSFVSTHERRKEQNRKEQNRKLSTKTTDNHKCFKDGNRVIHSLSTLKFSRSKQTQQQEQLQQQQQSFKGQTIPNQKRIPKQKEEDPSSQQASVYSDDGMKHLAFQQCGHIFGPRMFLIVILSVSSFLSLAYFIYYCFALFPFTDALFKLQNHFVTIES